MHRSFVTSSRERLGDARGIRRVGHDVELVLAHPPHDDVVDDEAVVIQEVRVLGAPGLDLA